MKVYKLKKHFRGIKKGTKFCLIAESEFIGVKEFVLRTEDLVNRISINETELHNYFTFLGDRGINPFRDHLTKKS
jgi:hypothetical protein